MLAITTDETGLSIRPGNRSHTIGLLLLSAATIGLLIALTDAYIT